MCGLSGVSVLQQPAANAMPTAMVAKKKAARAIHKACTLIYEIKVPVSLVE
jgi:hypothetical protein